MIRRLRPSCSIDVSVGTGDSRKKETRPVHMRVWPWLRWPLLVVDVTVTAPPGCSWQAGGSNRPRA